jgi:hypothetical protein
MAYIGPDSYFGLIVVGGALVWAIVSRRDSIKIPSTPIGGSRRHRGGHWASELPHMYADDEPERPVETLLSTGDPVSLEKRLVLNRQAFFEQNRRQGLSTMEDTIPVLLHEGQDESGFILEPSDARAPRSRALEQVKRGRLYLS